MLTALSSDVSAVHCAQATGIRTYGFAYSGHCYIYNSYLCHWKARNFVGLYQEDGLLRLCLV